MQKPIRRGIRVRLTVDCDRYPHAVAPAGCTGTDCLGVKLDQAVPGLEDWENILHFYRLPDPDDEVVACSEEA